jgi:hypothetical protein
MQYTSECGGDVLNDLKSDNEQANTRAGSTLALRLHPHGIPMFEAMKQAPSFDAFPDRYLEEVSDTHKKAAAARDDRRMLKPQTPASGSRSVPGKATSDFCRSKNWAAAAPQSAEARRRAFGGIRFLPKNVKDAPKAACRRSTSLRPPKLLGHSQAATTARYAQLDSERGRAARHVECPLLKGRAGTPASPDLIWIKVPGARGPIL